MKPPYAIGSVPSLSGHAIAYRWRSMPRVRRHRASKPQGSSERVLPWQITMDQLIFAFLSHTHYWYEVGMLKVPDNVGEKPTVIHAQPPIIVVSHSLRCCCFRHIDRSGLNHTQYYTWLPIRYVVCWTEKDQRNIYKASTRAKEKHMNKNHKKKGTTTKYTIDGQKKR